MIEFTAYDDERTWIYSASAEDLLSAQILATTHFVGLYGGKIPLVDSRIDTDEAGNDRAFYLIEDDYQRVELHMRTIECTVLPFRRR